MPLQRMSIPKLDVEKPSLMLAARAAVPWGRACTACTHDACTKKWTYTKTDRVRVVTFFLQCCSWVCCHYYLFSSLKFSSYCLAELQAPSHFWHEQGLRSTSLVKQWIGRGIWCSRVQFGKISCFDWSGVHLKNQHWKQASPGSHQATLQSLHR